MLIFKYFFIQYNSRNTFIFKVDVACRAYHQESLEDDDVENDMCGFGEDGVSPKEVGHNIYILCHQLAQHNKELAALLKLSEMNTDPHTHQALNYYASHTAQIEVSMSIILPGFLLINVFIFILS